MVSSCAVLGELISFMTELSLSSPLLFFLSDDGSTATFTWFLPRPLKAYLWVWEKPTFAPSLRAARFSSEVLTLVDLSGASPVDVTGLDGFAGALRRSSARRLFLLLVAWFLVSEPSARMLLLSFFLSLLSSLKGPFEFWSSAGLCLLPKPDVSFPVGPPESLPRVSWPRAASFPKILRGSAFSPPWSRPVWKPPPVPRMLLSSVWLVEWTFRMLSSSLILVNVGRLPLSGKGGFKSGLGSLLVTLLVKIFFLPISGSAGPVLALYWPCSGPFGVSVLISVSLLPASFLTSRTKN